MRACRPSLHPDAPAHSEIRRARTSTSLASAPCVWLLCSKTVLSCRGLGLGRGLEGIPLVMPNRAQSALSIPARIMFVCECACVCLCVCECVCVCVCVRSLLRLSLVLPMSFPDCALLPVLDDQVRCMASQLYDLQSALEVLTCDCSYPCRSSRSELHTFHFAAARPVGLFYVARKQHLHQWSIFHVHDYLWDRSRSHVSRVSPLQLGAQDIIVLKCASRYALYLILAAMVGIWAKSAYTPVASVDAVSPDRRIG